MQTNKDIYCAVALVLKIFGTEMNVNFHVGIIRTILTVSQLRCRCLESLRQGLRPRCEKGPMEKAALEERYRPD